MPQTIPDADEKALRRLRLSEKEWSGREDSTTEASHLGEYPARREDASDPDRRRRALSADEVHRILTACKKSRSRSLYPAVMLSLHTGLRNAELRHLRWRQIDMLEREIIVGKSKTAVCEGRAVSLSNTAFEALQEWRHQFPDAHPAHFGFPTERYGLDGEEGYLSSKCAASETDPTKPIGSWKTAWPKARRDVKVQCRWHDMRPRS